MRCAVAGTFSTRYHVYTLASVGHAHQHSWRCARDVHGVCIHVWADYNWTLRQNCKFVPKVWGYIEAGRMSHCPMLPPSMHPLSTIIPLAPESPLPFPSLHITSCSVNKHISLPYFLGRAWWLRLQPPCVHPFSFSKPNLLGLSPQLVFGIRNQKFWKSRMF